MNLMMNIYLQHLLFIYIECTGSTTMSVTANISSITVSKQALFSFPEELSHPKSCSFNFGIDDMYINLTESGVYNSSSTDTSIIFDFDGLQKDSTYNYNMTCDVTSTATNYTLVIQGTFRSSECHVK